MYLELTGVRKMYDEDNGVKQIDLAVEKGMLMTLLGPSGCGKSTLLKSLNRMNDLVEGCKITGKILLDGEDIYGDMDLKSAGRLFKAGCRKYFSGWSGDHFPCTGGTSGVYSLSELCSVSAHECPGKCVLWPALFSPDEETGRSTGGREIS